MSKWSKFASWGLLGAMAFNIAGTAYYFVLKQRIAATHSPPVIEAESKFPAFSGVDLSGKEWRASEAPCRVIRMTSDDCAYCKKDKPSYAKLLEAGRAASCEITELAPRAGMMAKDARPGVVQLKFIDADLGAVLAPFATPQTIILDRNWTLKLNRRGYFSDEALKEALEVLASFGAQGDGASKTTARR